MTSVTSEAEMELRVEVAVVIPADTRLMLDSNESAELNSKVVFISWLLALVFRGLWTLAVFSSGEAGTWLLYKERD